MTKQNILLTIMIGSMLLAEVSFHSGSLLNGSGRSAASAVAEYKGSDLDREFVRALKSRYEDTLLMAERERDFGANPELRHLADVLIEARKRELGSLQRYATVER